MGPRRLELQTENANESYRKHERQDRGGADDIRVARNGPHTPRPHEVEQSVAAACLPRGVSFSQHQNENGEGLLSAEPLVTLWRRRVRSKFGPLQLRQCEGAGVSFNLARVIADQHSDDRREKDHQDESDSKINHRRLVRSLAPSQ